MSDMLTHWATSEDILELATVDASIEPILQHVAKKDRDFARLGALTRYGNSFMAPVLKGARTRFGTASWTERDERNVAFVLGGLAHQACDNGMKDPLTEAVDLSWGEVHGIMRGPSDMQAARAEDVRKVQELSAYCDAEVFRHVYMNGGATPFSKFFMAEVSEEGRDFENFVRSMFQRSMLASHTFIPDLNNVEGWLDNVFRVVQPLYLDVDLWVKVYQHPDPAKVEAYGIKKWFYKEDDPTIQLARKLQRGQSMSDDDKRAVFDRRATTCAYGEVLQIGLGYLRNASAFWRGEVKELISPNHESAPKPILAS
jgi:hypothetical protein